MGILKPNVLHRALDGQLGSIENVPRYVRLRGTEILAALYSDAELTNLRANPMKTDADGNYAPCYLEDGEYTLVMEDPDAGEIIATEDVFVAGDPQSGVLRGFRTVSALLGDWTLSYNSANATLRAFPGEMVTVSDGAFAYIIAEQDATDHHLETVAGVRLYVQPQADRSVRPDQFGIDITGGSDSADAMQSMFDAGFPVVNLKGATIRLDSGLVLTKDVEILTDKTTLLDYSNMPAASSFGNRIAIRVQGAVGSSIPLVGDSVISQTAVTIPDGQTEIDVLDTGPFEKRDMVLLRSNAFFRDGVTAGGGTRGWLTRVAEVSNGNTLTLTEAMRANLLMADSATATLVSPIRFSWRGGGRLIGLPDSGHIGLLIEYAEWPVVDGIVLEHFSHSALSFKACYDWTAYDILVKGANSQGIPNGGNAGYGLSISEGSVKGRVRGGQFIDCRHAIATGGATAAVYDPLFEDCHSESSGKSTHDYDIHEETIGARFVNCISRAGAGGSGGFGLRGYNTTLTSCRVFSGTGPGFKLFSDAADSLGLTGNRFVDCHTYGSGSYGFWINGTASCAVNDTWLIACSSNDDLLENIYATYFSGLWVDGFAFGNVLTNPGADGNNVRLHASVAGAAKNAHFSDCHWRGSVASGIRLLLSGDGNERPEHVKVRGGRVEQGAVFAQGPRARWLTFDGIDVDLTKEFWKGSASNVTFRGITGRLESTTDLFEMKSGTAQNTVVINGCNVVGNYDRAVDFDANVTSSVILGNTFGGNAISAPGTGVTIQYNI